MQRSLHAKAETVRRALAETADRVSVEWSFTVKRGHVTRAMLEAAGAADLLITGRESLPLAAPPRRRPMLQAPIVVVYDGSQACIRALEAAAALARLTAGRIVIVAAGSDPKEADKLRQQGAAICQSLDITATWDPRFITDPGALIDAAHRAHARVVFLSRDSGLLGEAALDRLVQQLDCPVALVR
jgi:nucleotide-binding universal stress UspA family protein